MIPRVPLLQVGELCQTARADVGRGPARLVKVYHTLCLCQGVEPLGAPLAVAVRGLVADFDSHCRLAVDLLIVAGDRGPLRVPLCHLSDCHTLNV